MIRGLCNQYHDNGQTIEYSPDQRIGLKLTRKFIWHEHDNVRNKVYHQEIRCVYIHVVDNS